MCTSSPAAFQQDLELTKAPKASLCRTWFMQWNKQIRKLLVRYTPPFLMPKLSECTPCGTYDRALANSQAVMTGWTGGLNTEINRRYFALCEVASRFERN